MKNLNINPTEKLLIKLMLEETELIESIKERLEPADFQDERVSKIVSIMFDLIEQGKSIEPRNLINHLPEIDISQIICESTFLPEVSSQDKEKVVDDCIQRLKNERLKLKKQRLHDQIKQAQHLGDEESLQRLAREFQYLINKR
jgi:replicative DNA helicase